MADIALGKLIYTAGIDSRPLMSAVNGMDAAISRFAKSASAALASIRAPTIKMPAPTMPKVASTGLGKLDAGPAAASLDKLTGSSGAASFGLASLALKAGAVGVGLAAIKVAGDAIGGAFDFLKDGIKGASDLDEQLNATNSILGQGAPAVVKLADEMADKFGSSKQAVLETATSIAALGKGAGLSGEKLNTFSTSMTKLADDFGSVANKELPEVGKAFSIALSGETSDLLKRYGIDTREAAVEAYAFSHGIAEVGTKLEESQRVMAVSGILQEKLAFAMGDHDKTATGFANSLRRLTGTFDNFSTQVGAAIMPVGAALVGLASDGLAFVSRMFVENKDTIKGWAEAAGTAIKLVGIGIANWRDSWEIAKTATEVGLYTMRDNLYAFGNNVIKIGGYIRDNWLALVKDMASLWSTMVTNAIDNFLNLGSAVLDFAKGGKLEMPKLKAPWEGFKAQAPALPAMDAAQVSPDRAEASNRLAGLVSKMLDKLPKPAAPAAPGMAAKPGAPTMTANQVDAAKKAHTELENFARSLKDKARIPMEEYAHQLKQGLEAYNKGLIDKTELSRLDRVAKKEAGIESPEARFAGANEIGSQEAYSMIVKAMYSTAPKNTDAAATRKATEESAKLNKQILEALRNPQPVRRAPDAQPALA